MRYHVIDTLSTWSEIRDCLDTFVGDWVFRGHQDASWRLCATIERATTLIPKQLAEHVVYRHFTRNMHAYLASHEMPTDLLECFALMQHHGAPTRLLDFTYSAYTACFFAIERALDLKGHCAVWAVDQWWCKNNGKDVVRSNLGSNPSYAKFKMGANTLEADAFSKIFYEEKLQLVLPVEPYRRNTRLTIQQGLFLCPGNVNKGFEGNLEAYDNDEPEKHVVKVLIPNHLRVEILTDLNYMNINRATLFPGIDGFSQSLVQAIIDLEDHGQINKRMQKRNKFGAPFI